MMGKTHRVGGILTGIATSSVFLNDNMLQSGLKVVALLTGAILGSYLSDIDKKESTIGRRLWFISWPIYLFRLLIKILSLVLPKKIRPFFKKIYKQTGHRYLAHSLVTWLIVSLLFNIICSTLFYSFETILQLNILLPIAAWLPHNVFLIFSIGLSVGMLSHIVLDYFSDTGEALFAPFSDKKFKFPITMSTNGIMEQLLYVTMNLFVPILSYKIYYQFYFV